MACPFFSPTKPLPWGRWNGKVRPPLGRLYDGQCKVRQNVKQGDDFRPPGHLIENACNMGYARDECDRFAGESGPDAVRFVLRNDDGRAARIDYTMERAHLPWAHGSVTFQRAGRKWSGLDAGTVLRAQAEAYLRSYLEWKESESATEEQCQPEQE